MKSEINVQASYPEIDLTEAIRLVKSTKQFFSNTEMSSHITKKGPADYVTETDFSIQNFLRQNLLSAYPGIQFMAEEGGNSTPDFSGGYWVLDPVDGTTNLIHRFMHSAVSLALCFGDKVIGGIIYCPFTEELFTASRGHGAFLNGVPIHVSAASSLRESLVSIGTTPYHRQHSDAVFDRMKKIFARCQDIRLIGSAAIELAYVACGRTEAYVEQNLKPWDFAAGLLLIEEAGGRVCTFLGEQVLPYRPSDILADNGLVEKELLDLQL